MFKTMNPELPLRMTVFPVLVYTATGSRDEFVGQLSLLLQHHRC